MAKKKLAKTVRPVQSLKEQNSAEQQLAAVTDAEKWKAVARLAGIARGSALILGNLWTELNDARWQQIASGLSEALREYADEVDVLCFQSAGNVARNIHPDLLAAVLKQELAQVSKRM